MNALNFNDHKGFDMATEIGPFTSGFDFKELGVFLEAQLRDVRETFDPQLSTPLSDAEAIALAQLMSIARIEQNRLEMDFNRSVIPPKKYLERMNELTRAISSQEQRILGKERFVELFGDAGAQPEGLIDSEAFYRTNIPKI